MMDELIQGSAGYIYRTRLTFACPDHAAHAVLAGCITSVSLLLCNELSHGSQRVHDVCVTSCRNLPHA